MFSLKVKKNRSLIIYSSRHEMSNYRKCSYCTFHVTNHNIMLLKNIYLSHTNCTQCDFASQELQAYEVYGLTTVNKKAPFIKSPHIIAQSTFMEYLQYFDSISSA